MEDNIDESLYPVVISEEIEEVEAEEVPNEEFDELVINTRPIVIDASYFEKTDNSGAIGLGDNCETEGVDRKSVV